MSFNFGVNANESAVRSTRKPLKPWDIYDVIFKGCEVKEFDGKKDPSQHYTTVRASFETEDGDYFTVNKFLPKDANDTVRRKVDNKNGGTRELASNFEEFWAFIKQTVYVLNPDGFKKLQAAASKFKTPLDAANALVTLTKPAINKTTKLKLVGISRDGKVEASIPRLVGINNEGVEFVADNYIGDKLFFSDYEEGKRKEYLSATPTVVKTDVIENTPSAAVESEDTFDLDDLLAE
jgi:hypothetical protein